MIKKLILVSILVGILFGINYITQNSKQPAVNKETVKEEDFLDDFRNQVDISDGIITEFGSEFAQFLSGETEPEDYVESVRKFRSNLAEIQNTTEKIKPTGNYQKTYNKFRNGLSLVLEVLNKNVEYLSAENPDPDLMKDDQDKFSEGLQEIQEVKESLNADNEPDNKT